MSIIKKVLDIYSEVLWTISALCFFSIFLVNLANVFARQFLGFSVLWALDFSMLLISWSIYLGMATAVYRGDHIAVTFLVDRFPWHIQKSLFILMRVALLVICIILFREGIIVATHRMGVLFTILRWPTGYAFAALPVFAASSFVFLFYNMIQAIRELITPPAE